MAAKPLTWRPPKDDGQDYGHEDAAWLADGIGGIYAIMPDALLWWAHDPFVWVQCDDIDHAKATAEADWQAKYAALAERDGREG